MIRAIYHSLLILASLAIIYGYWQMIKPEKNGAYTTGELMGAVRQNYVHFMMIANPDCDWHQVGPLDDFSFSYSNSCGKDEIVAYDLTGLIRWGDDANTIR